MEEKTKIGQNMDKFLNNFLQANIMICKNLKKRTTAMGQGNHAANLVQQESDEDSLLAESLNHLALAAITDK